MGVALAVNGKAVKGTNIMAVHFITSEVTTFSYGLLRFICMLLPLLW